MPASATNANILPEEILKEPFPRQWALVNWFSFVVIIIVDFSFMDKKILACEWPITDTCALLH